MPKWRPEREREDKASRNPEKGPNGETYSSERRRDADLSDGIPMWATTQPEGMPPPIDDDESRDVNEADCASLDGLNPDLASAMRSAYLDAFFDESKLSPLRRHQAWQMLTIDRGVFPDGSLNLRVTFPFMGPTSWWGWEGDDEEALEIASELGGSAGHDVGWDQAHGPTGWEPQFDDQIPPT